MGKRFQLISALTIACSLVVAGCNGTNENNSYTSGGAPERMQPVPVKAARRDLVGFDLLSASLYVPPEASAPITVANEGPVERVAVVPGQYVRRGQLVVELQDSSQQEDYTDAKQAYDAAKTAYASAKTQYDQPVEQAKSQLEQAQSQLSQDKADAAQGGGDNDLQSDEQAVQQARSNLEQATTGERSNMLQYRDQLFAAQRALATARSSAREGIITAPISGTVVSLSVVAGQEVGTSPHQVIGQVVDLDAIEVKATIADSQMKIATPGTHVVLAFGDIPNRVFDGRITQVRSVPAPNGATVHEATIAFGNRDHLVKPSSMLSSAGIRVGEVKDALAVPVEAVRQMKDGTYYVKVQANGQWQDTPVTIGLSDGHYTQIKSGLNDGDTVLAG